ncbi:MAG: hypothetical protein EP330_03985 [Deltaproteobacteria bacterium]|nr:MAG: hypothetical protein EP330_03985 [Deltaproteobacteria bacterium]
MEQARRLVIATLVSTVLLTLFIGVVGWLSPSEWEVHARAVTQLSTAEVRTRLVSRSRWEALRGEAFAWQVDDAVHARWGPEGVLVLTLTPDADGVGFRQEIRGGVVAGRFDIDDTGELRDVRFTLAGRTEGGALERFLLRFERGRFQDRAQAELEGLLAADEVAGVARGRRLDNTWGCGEGACAVIRLVEPLELAGTDVHVEAVSTAEFLCVPTPLVDPSAAVACP